MTNGEKLQSIFPNMEYEVKDNTVLTDVDNGSWFSLDWWNAEYIESTTKNDLEVDAVSRKEVINQIFYSTDNNGDVVLNSALRERIAKLPSVTPQKPKSEWKHDHEILRAYADGANNVLDKVRTEMFEEMLSHSGTGEEAIQAYADGLKKGLEFIDKYRTESEDKE